GESITLECAQDIYTVRVNEAENSVNPMNSECGKMLTDIYFREFERRCPGMCGKSLNYFFQDELMFGADCKYMWDQKLPLKFSAEKGYDLIPLLPALFYDLGDVTPKIRLDYADVKTSLIEDGYFKPIYEFHAQHNMIYGCDQSGRGKQPDEFSDYFRTVRWFTAPGNDTPGRSADMIKVKVNSSIAHLYERPRVWLEGYHSSGWGTTLESITAPTSDNFIFGANLLNLHGLYYSTNGGFFEWAPPDFHFRMPYWDDEKAWLKKYERLACLLTTGTHCCDAAIFYPVPAASIGSDGEDACSLSFLTAETLFNAGIDFDFTDTDSLLRADISSDGLSVSGETYKVLVFADVKAIKYKCVQALERFAKAGGKIIFIKAPPRISDRAGRNDEALNRDINSILHSGNAAVLECADEAVKYINENIRRDFMPVNPTEKTYVNHRKCGDEDLYFVRYAGQGKKCRFAPLKKPYILDIEAEKVYEVKGFEQSRGFTEITMPLDKNADTLILFSDAPVKTDGVISYETETAEAVGIVSLDGEWSFSLIPTLDNTYGDFCLPAGGVIGAQARFFKCVPADSKYDFPDFDEVNARTLPYCHSVGFRSIAVKPGDDPAAICKAVCKDKSVFSSDLLHVEGNEYYISDLKLHDRYGFVYNGDDYEQSLCEQGHHGLKGCIFEDNLYFDSDIVFFAFTDTGEARIAQLITGDIKPELLFVNGLRCNPSESTVLLAQGKNTVAAFYSYKSAQKSALLRNEGKIKRATLLLADPSLENKPSGLPLAVNRFANDRFLRFEGIDAFYNTYAFSFPTLPSFSGFELICFGNLLAASSDGTPLEIKQSGKTEYGASIYTVLAPEPSEYATEILMFIKTKPGYSYTGIIPEPVRLFHTEGYGKILCGDWSKNGALCSYSGKISYLKTVNTVKNNELKYVLELGRVCATCSVEINGRLCARLTHAPFNCDITDCLSDGENRICVTVSNTLCNHYSTIPSRYSNYPRDAVSGLIGPVYIRAFQKNQ
ncbi:MAG: hypothetical protein GX851_04900, partial [Clostridiales bacterium]|nr:hypothetical protein [Clostridiales bacterium]